MTEEIEQLRKLAKQLSDAKDAEEIARELRIGIEQQIAELVPTDEEGQRTISLGSRLKLTVKRGLIYKADTDEIARTLNQLGLKDGNKYPVPVKTTTKVTLDTAGYRQYREELPEVWKAISQHVTAKPAKVAVTLKGE